MVERLIVIGSNSFSGAHIVDAALKKGMTVLGISRSDEPDDFFLPYRWGGQRLDRFTFLKLDLNHDLKAMIEEIKEFKPEYIINFAAQGMVAESWESPEDWFETNTLSTIKLHYGLLKCRSLEKFVQVSTPEVYGSRTGILKENIFYDPSTPYAVSKAAADMSLMAMFRRYGFPVVFTRSANVYGPGQQLYRVIPKAVIRFLTGQAFELHGGGTSVRSFIHIKDVARGTLKTMTLGKPGNIYHLTTDEYVTIRSLVQRIADCLGLSFNDHVVDIDDRPGKDQFYRLDGNKAFNHLGWKPELSLDSGLKSTVLWIKKRISRFQDLALEYKHKR